MSASTGPVLAAGGIVAFNAIIVQKRSPATQARTAVATLISAAGLSLMERALPGTAVALSWLVLIGVLLVRVDPTTPAPVESIRTWINKG